MHLQGNSMPRKSLGVIARIFSIKIMKYYFEKEGEREEVKIERWVWGVIYKDDTELHQFENSGRFHQIGEVDQDQVKMACLYNFAEWQKKKDFSKMSKIIYLPFQNQAEDGSKMKLIHKYRNIRPAGYDEFVFRIYMFGFTFGNKQCFYYVLPNDRFVVSPEDNIDLTLFNLEQK